MRMRMSLNMNDLEILNPDKSLSMEMTGAM